MDWSEYLFIHLFGLLCCFSKGTRHRMEWLNAAGRGLVLTGSSHKSSNLQRYDFSGRFPSLFASIPHADRLN